MQVFFGSGLCFFLENNGDPWHDYENHADPYLTYFTSFYYMVVTMSTVGYGDVVCVTACGRGFQVRSADCQNIRFSHQPRRFCFFSWVW